MSTRDTAESLRAELKDAVESLRHRSLNEMHGEVYLMARRAIARLALLERGIERANELPMLTYDSLLALIEELGRE